MAGILPPYVGDATVAANMSPYVGTILEVAQQFCATDRRKEIFRGLLEYRARLNAVGLTDGMQWLSGSFLEDIEKLDRRPPRDVDIVMFAHAPATVLTVADLQAFITTNQVLFDHSQVKATFKVDMQFVSLDNPSVTIVSHTRFWFGLFSHRRTGVWKGLVQVPLAVGADDAAAAALVAP